jgi:Ulp1 family protease
MSTRQAWFKWHIIIFPVHLNENHWAVVKIDTKEKVFTFMDSYGQGQSEMLFRTGARVSISSNSYFSLDHSTKA